MRSGGRARVEFFGTQALLKKLDEAGKNVEEACANALVASCEKPKREMKAFIAEHRYSGQTERSWTEELKKEGSKIFYEFGYSIRKGGIASLFLNLGTPKMQPTFFIDRAVEENIDEIKRKQLETLRGLLM